MATGDEEAQQQQQQQQQGVPPGAAPSAEQQRLDSDKIAILLTSYTELDNRAKEALLGLTLQQVVKILSDYEQKKPTIRNPSGFVYKTALRWSEGTATNNQEDDDFSSQLPERTPQQELEIQTSIEKHDLNETAQGLLRQLPYRTAMRILNDLESKGSTVRNPSAYCSTAARKARQREDKRRGRTTSDGDGIPGQSGVGEVEVVDVVNHYEALEIEDTADEGTIKKAYRKLVLKWHPDKHPADRDEAEEKIRAINEAYEVLSNPTKKGAYDQQRRAVEQRKAGKVLRSTICVKTDLPRECMLQPVGYPDKFLRYRQGTGRGSALCFVQSRAEARRDGGDINLEEFMPFFEATKLSFWWLPEVNSMCRIRAAELGTRETKGEAVRAGKAGGLNLAFKPEAHESEQDSGVKLIEARKGELKEMVNWIVVPSPHYEGAFRFEAAYVQGYYIAFRPPTGLRVIPYQDGMDTNCIVDFSLIDYAHMFKFIELEEVLRSAMISVQNWIALDVLKMDANVQAYFGNILGVPMWDDDDFQTYFAGHFDIWEYRVDLRSVRLRTREERLGLELQTVATPEQMAQKVVTASPETLMRLPWRSVRHAFAVLNRPGSEEVSSVLARMEAKRKLIGLLGGVLATAQAERDSAAPPLVAIVGLAHQVHLISGDPGLAKTRDEAVDLLVKRVAAEVDAADAQRRSLDLELADYADLVALPGMAERDEAILRLISGYFNRASVADLVLVAGAANAASIASITKATAAVALELLDTDNMADTCRLVRTVLRTGVLEERCLQLLPRCAAAMDLGDLAACIAHLANKGNASRQLSEAIATLVARAPLARKVSKDGLMNLAVAGTKTELINPAMASVAEAAAMSLSQFSSADVVRLLLAVAKAKGKPIAKEAKDRLFRQAAELLRPQLPKLSTVEIIKVGLASGGAAGPGELLETVALEAEKRLADVQAPQLLLLTQALTPLGGASDSMQRLVDHWAEVLEDDARKEPGSAPVLSAEQLVKLTTALGPVVSDLTKVTLQRCLTVFGAQLLKNVEQISAPGKEAISKLFSRSRGFGLWKDKDKLLRFLPICKDLSPTPPRERDRSRSRRGSRGQDGAAPDAGSGAAPSRAPEARSRSRDRDAGRGGASGEDHDAGRSRQGGRGGQRDRSDSSRDSRDRRRDRSRRRGRHDSDSRDRDYRGRRS